jgi:hypothetical protein
MSSIGRGDMKRFTQVGIFVAAILATACKQRSNNEGETESFLNGPEKQEALAILTR